MINFEKFKGVHDSVVAVLAYQKHIQDHQPILEREGRLGPLAYLEDQLAATVIGKPAEDKLEARSLELQKQEDRDYEHRVNELAAVGFRTSRGRGQSIGVLGTFFSDSAPRSRSGVEFDSVMSWQSIAILFLLFYFLGFGESSCQCGISLHSSRFLAY